uniref:Protein kinase domain-containing protein n=1 Tax=Palpitomonas bilix TaxID=652834 RepID=A0A7S3D392_9EUKA|mmetsp:Transcript_19693/g.50417  ORF Transcript_19693/g.50417 Transcript_19693/m.50417 type:complete len:372 (+) Transcript_19693:258-1373(+)
MYLKVVRLQLDSGRVFFSSNATSKPTSSIVLEGGSCSRGEERNSLVVEGRHGSTSTRIIFPTTAVLEGWETALTLHQSGVIRQINRAEDVWRIADKLGEGAFSSVYRATAQEGEKVVALKILPKRLLPSSSDRLRVFREIETLQFFGGDGVISFEGCAESNDSFFIASELCEGGTALDVAQASEREGPLPEQKISECIRSVLLCLQRVHLRGYIHRDIKAENIAFKVKGSLRDTRLLDLGLSLHTDIQAATLETVGTDGYAAPEVVAGKPYALNADVFSVGALTLLLCCQIFPFSSGEEAVSSLAAAEEGLRLGNLWQWEPPAEEDGAQKKWSALSAHCKDFVQRCLALPPSQRPGVDDLIVHPFISSKIP